MRALSGCGVLVLVCASSTAAQRASVTVSLLDSSYLSIGSIDGPPETQFAGIVAAVHLPSGDVAVADGGSHVVRFFDASGVHLRSVGREGSGPGEFRALQWINTCGDEELLAVDAALGRGVVLSAADGRLLHDVRLPSWIGSNQYLACEGSGQVVVLLHRPRDVAPPGEVMRYPAAVIRVSLDSGAQDTLVQLSGTDFYFATHVRGYSFVPLGAQAMAASGGGRVYAAQNNEEQIHVIDLETGQRASFPHRLPQPRMTAAAWESAKSQFIEQQAMARTRRLLADVLAETPAPTTHPRFLGMKADRMGRLWLRLPSSGSSGVWKVLNPDGSQVGSVQLASNVEPLDIGESYLIGVERGPLDVQTIRVYSFSKPLFPPEK